MTTVRGGTTLLTTAGLDGDGILGVAVTADSGNDGLIMGDAAICTVAGAGAV